LSVGLAAGSTRITVGPLETGRLLITQAPGTDGALRSSDSCPVHHVHALLDRVLESRTVLVERRDGSAPLRLPARAARESELAWLVRVIAAVVGEVTDAALARCVVGEVIQRTANVPIAIECRAPDETATRHGEFRLVRTARGVWIMVCPSGCPGIGADYSALLAALTRCLCEADANDTRAQNGVRQQLARAVAAPDPGAFVTAAAQLLGGSVCLRDSSGLVVAATGSRLEAQRAREIVLRDESGLRGVLEIDTVCAAGADVGLADLACALLRLCSAEAERHALENRLAVLGCFVERDLNGRGQARAGKPQRMVMIAPNRLANVSMARRIVGRLLRAAREISLLADLSLVAQDNALVGVYSDDGSPADAHRRGWQRLLAAADASGSLLVAVSTSAPSAGDSRAQYQLVRQVGDLQRDGSDLFDLPCVAVVDELGPLAGVLNAVPGTQVLPYVQRVIGDLISDGRFGGQLVDTLYAYLQAGCSPGGAGALLHLHGSSVKYRMRVLRELLGERLDDPGKRFELELALRLYLAARELAAGVNR
jgi:hypothetical protein